MDEDDQLAGAGPSQPDGSSGAHTPESFAQPDASEFGAGSVQASPFAWSVTELGNLASAPAGGPPGSAHMTPTPASPAGEAMQLDTSVRSTFTSGRGEDASGEALSQDAAEQIALPYGLDHLDAAVQNGCCSARCLSVLLGCYGQKPVEWVVQIARGLRVLRPLWEGGNVRETTKLVRKKPDAAPVAAKSADSLTAAELLLLLGEGARGSKHDAERVRHDVVTHAVYRLRQPTFLPGGGGSVCIEACVRLLDCERNYLYKKSVSGGVFQLGPCSTLPVPLQRSLCLIS
jgi:hypothetical protein